ESGAAPRKTVCLDSAAVTLNDPVDDGQSQPRTLARRFGGEKGLEDLVPDLRRDAAAGVGKLQLHSLRPPGGMAADGDGPGAVHGIRGIEEQVGKDLLDLARIADDLRQSRVQFLEDLDIVKKCLVVDQVDAVADDLVGVEKPLFPQGMTAKVQQAID